MVVAERAASPNITLSEGSVVAIPTEATRSTRMPLSQMPLGSRAVVSDSDLDESDASLLRAMGLGPNAEVRMCRLGEPCIVALPCGCDAGGCRIGLSRRIAERVYVRAIPV